MRAVSGLMDVCKVSNVEYHQVAPCTHCADTPVQYPDSEAAAAVDLANNTSQVSTGSGTLDHHARRDNCRGQVLGYLWCQLHRCHGQVVVVIRGPGGIKVFLDFVSLGSRWGCLRYSGRQLGQEVKGGQGRLGTPTRRAACKRMTTSSPRKHQGDNSGDASSTREPETY